MRRIKRVKIVPTHTGKIYVDTDRQLEFLTVGDYGKENNIKANFLGLTKEINGVANTSVDLSQKWVATISTQKGCPMKCQFCDCPKYGFHGNATIEDLIYEITTIFDGESVDYTKRFNVHFARMGEPTFNENVLTFAKSILRNLVNEKVTADTIHPVVSTMLPKSNKRLEEFILQWCDVKNIDYKGEAGMQFSINSTDDEQRKQQFNGMSLNLSEISELARKLPMPIGRKYTLNFAVTSQTILDAKRLSDLFDKNKFIVKITPIHETKSAITNGFDVTTSYTDYDVYRKFEQPLLDEGWDVIVFVPSKEEDSDRITCGNALISYADKLYEEDNKMTYDGIIDGLEMMDFFADRAGKELWFDKPTDIQNQDIAKHHQILQSAIKNLKEQRASKWIKCSDKMPPQYETVICYSKLNGIMIGMWEEANIPDSKEKGIWFMTDGVQSEKVATHWMSFPNPPDESE